MFNNKYITKMLVLALFAVFGMHGMAEKPGMTPEEIEEYEKLYLTTGESEAPQIETGMGKPVKGVAIKVTPKVAEPGVAVLKEAKPGMIKLLLTQAEKEAIAKYIDANIKNKVSKLLIEAELRPRFDIKYFADQLKKAQSPVERNYYIILTQPSKIDAAKTYIRQLLASHKKELKIENMTPEEIQLAKKVNFYNILGIYYTPGEIISLKTIKNAYETAKKNTTFPQEWIKIAFDVLSNNKKRAQYYAGTLSGEYIHSQQGKRAPAIKVPSQKPEVAQKGFIEMPQPERDVVVYKYNVPANAKKWLIEQLRILSGSIKEQPTLMRAFANARRTLQLKPYNKNTLLEVQEFVNQGAQAKEIQQNTEQANRLAHVQFVIEQVLKDIEQPQTRVPSQQMKTGGAGRVFIRCTGKRCKRVNAQ